MYWVIFLSLIANSAFALPEKQNFKKISARMYQVSFSSCTKVHCLKVSSPNVSEGFFVRGLSFANSKLIYSEPKTGKLLKFSAKNVFYDYYSKRMFIEGINGDFKKEAIYEIDSGALKKF
jgi:hypothetical protein